MSKPQEKHEKHRLKYMYYLPGPGHSGIPAFILEEKSPHQKSTVVLAVALVLLTLQNSDANGKAVTRSRSFN